MKHFALATLTLLCVFACSAQGYDEIVFEVKKKQDIKVSTYLYRQQQQAPNASKGSAPYNYSCIQKVGDTLFHYTLKNIRDTVGLTKDGYAPRIDRNNKYFDYQYCTVYNVINDTVWEKRIYSNGYFSYEMFCNNNMLTTGSKEDYIRKWNVEETFYRIAYMLDSNVRIGVEGKVYDCIKVLVSYGTPQTNGRVINKTTPWLYSRTYFYLLKSNYLPIKIVPANKVKKLDTYSDYIPDAPPFELIKAIE